MGDLINAVVLSSGKGQEDIDHRAEQQLRELELTMARDNIAYIHQAAQAIGRQLMNNPTLTVNENPEELCWQRYIVAPLLYKLGFTEQASTLKQKTFELLFPVLHNNIQNKLDTLYGTNRLEKSKEILKLFNAEHPDIIYSYARTMKSTNSIWKKIPSMQSFLKMTAIDVATVIDDLIALRWNMKINEGENRYDALINGLQLLPKEHIVYFRNQHVQQSSGFDCEPVMKFYYVINGMPIECQLLGGQLEWYMNAKGYTDYKVNHSFTPLKSSLTRAQYDSRLGTCIYYQETGNGTDYHQLMLKELTEPHLLHYDTRHLFLLDEQPLSEKNVSLTFSDNEAQAIYQTSTHRFSSGKMEFSCLATKNRMNP